MSILFVAPHCGYYPPHPEAILNEKIVRELASMGMNVTLVSDGHHHDTDRTYDAIRRSARWDAKQSIPLMVDLMRGGTRAWWTSSGFVSAALSQAEASDISLIISRSRPFFAHRIGAAIADHVNKPLICSWNDPDPPRLSPSPVGQGLDAPWPTGYRRLFSYIAATASAFLFPCVELRDYMAHYLPQPPRSYVIPHMPPRTVPAFRRNTERFVLGYAGNLRQRPIAPILKAIAEIATDRSERPPLLRLMTHQTETALREVKEHAGEDLVEWHPVTGYQESLEFEAECDVLVLLEATMERSVFLPSKLVDYAAVGRPILAVGPVDGPVASLLSSSGQRVFSFEQVHEMAAFLRSVWNAPGSAEARSLVCHD